MVFHLREQHPLGLLLLFLYSDSRHCFGTILSPEYMQINRDSLAILPMLGNIQEIQRNVKGKERVISQSHASSVGKNSNSHTLESSTTLLKNYNEAHTEYV